MKTLPEVASHDVAQVEFVNLPFGDIWPVDVGDQVMVGEQLMEVSGYTANVSGRRFDRLSLRANRQTIRRMVATEHE